MNHRLPLLVTLTAFLSACAAGSPVDSQSSDETARRSDPWDSAAGNPTHATHSYLTEVALDALSADYPELATYRRQVLGGANEELHDLVLKDENLELLRHDFGGDNAACQHPEVVWEYAQYWYTHGQKDWAYYFVGILLHYVEDMGNPAHGFRVWHQSSPWNWDHFELLGLANWAPDFDEINRPDPAFEDPSSYVAFSAAWSTGDFGEQWPDAKYDRGFFHKTWLFASKQEKAFVKNREGRTAIAATWALESAVSHWPN